MNIITASSFFGWREILKLATEKFAKLQSVQPMVRDLPVMGLAIIS